MFPVLKKTIPALLVSLSLAIGSVTASATPARANGHGNGNEAAAVIGGIIALYAIARAIDRRNDRRDDHAQAHQPPVHQPTLIAPSRCFIRGQDGNGQYRGYVRRCMLNNASQAQLLPQNCLRGVHTPRGFRNIYGARCLARNGWVRG